MLPNTNEGNCSDYCNSNGINGDDKKFYNGNNGDNVNDNSKNFENEMMVATIWS